MQTKPILTISFWEQKSERTTQQTNKKLLSRSTDATAGTTRRGSASPTAFYDEWNSSAVSTERSEQTTIEVIGNEAELPRGVLLGPMDMAGQPSRLRPTAVLPARPSSTWRDQTVIFQEDETEKGSEKGSFLDLSENQGKTDKGENGGSMIQFGSKKESEEGGTSSPYVDILLKGSFGASLRQSEEKDTRGSGSGILLTPSSRGQEEKNDLSTVRGWRESLEDDLTEVTDSKEIVDAMSTTTTSAISRVQTTFTTVTTSTVTTSVPIQLTYRQKGHQYIEPTFLFTTSSPRQTKQLELTTTEMEDNPEERDGHSVPSHFFQLEDYPEEKNFSVEQSDDPGEFSEEADASVRASWMYNVNNNSSEELTESVATEKEVATNSSIPGNGTSNELERRPRDNTGEHESLEGPYKRLQAQYGSWQNGAGVQFVRTDQIFFVIFLLSQSLL